MGHPMVGVHSETHVHYGAQREISIEPLLVLIIAIVAIVIGISALALTLVPKVTHVVNSVNVHSSGP